MMSNMNRQWRLTGRPVGEDFDSVMAFGEEPIKSPGDGEILVKNLHLSLDPANRAWMNEGDTYKAAIPLGGVMEGFTVGVVEESKHPGFSVGDTVSGFGHWEDYSVTNGEGWAKSPDLNKQAFGAHLGIYAIVGPTAYFGLLNICKPQPGETVVVTTAAGAVGSLVGQIAKTKGCRVIGITGSDEKCTWITEELGFDAAINYKTEDVPAVLAKLCPDGIDCHFEQVGDSDILDAVLNLMNQNGRISMCGWISAYNLSELPAGPRALLNIIVKRIKMEGFIVFDFMDQMAQCYADLATWLDDGRLKYRVDVVDDLSNAVDALHTLYAGTNQGKLIVKVQDDPSLA